MLETDLQTNRIQTEPIRIFLNNADHQFTLMSEEKNEVTAEIYEGKVFNIKQNPFFGFWIFFPEEELNKLEHGVTYKLTPENDMNEYQWQVHENLAIEMP